MEDGFGRRLRDRRKFCGLTQEDLAQKAGYNGKAMVSLYETGRAECPPATVKKFAEILGCTYQWLMIGKLPITYDELDEMQSANPTHQESNISEVVGLNDVQKALLSQMKGMPIQDQIKLLLQAQAINLKNNEDSKKDQ